MPFSDHRHEFTPEAIRKRMAQHMLHLWGVKSLSSIDPFARLVMETLASELNKLSHELLNSEVGLLNRLAGLLTPDLLTVPRPAHAVAWVRPADPVVYMAPTGSLFFTKRVASKPYGELDTRRDIFLGAVDTVKLLHGRVAWLAAGNALYKTDGDGDKQLAHHTDKGHKLPPHSLWLGLDMHPDLTSLDRLGLYVELPHLPEPQALFDLLQLGSWSLNGQPLAAHPGLCYDPEPGHAAPTAPDAPHQLLADTSLDRLLEQDVKTTYHNRFVHLRQPEQPDLAGQARPYPAELAGYFAAPVLEELAGQPLLWLHVALPANFSEEVLARLNVRLNAVPVLNRRLHRLTYRTRVMHNILPLPVATRETFMAVRSLIDSRHRVFTPYPLREAERLDTGHYTVRRSGVERFDARNAHEQLHYLLEVLRDESVAFSAYGYDTVQLEAQSLNRQVTHLERLLTNQDGAVRELPHYLLVSPHEEFDTLEVSYWTTDCEDANNLRVGTELQPYDITYLAGQPLLLTTTTGGQNRLRAANQLDAYRYALLSHERIVTNEDIRSFMKAELGALLGAVSISKGVMVGTSAKQGFVRTIDVNLTPAADSLLSYDEWKDLCTSLKAKLISRSAQVSQYRLLVTSAP